MKSLASHLFTIQMSSAESVTLFKSMQRTNLNDLRVLFAERKQIRSQRGI